MLLTTESDSDHGDYISDKSYHDYDEHHYGYKPKKKKVYVPVFVPEKEKKKSKLVIISVSFFVFPSPMSLLRVLYTIALLSQKSRAMLHVYQLVVRFNATKRRLESFIVSYVSYRFITACS